MIAMLTGVISESMFEKNQARLEEQRQDRSEAHQAIEEFCRAKFSAFEKNIYGEVPLHRIRSILHEFEKLCDTHCIEYNRFNLNEALTNMDDNKNGCISLAEFSHCLLAFAEGSSPVSFMEIKHHLQSTKVFAHKSHDILRIVMTRLDGLENKVCPILQNIHQVAGEIHQLSKEVHATESLMDAELHQVAGEVHQVAGEIRHMTGPECYSNKKDEDDCSKKADNLFLELAQDMTGCVSKRDLSENKDVGEQADTSGAPETCVEQVEDKVIDVPLETPCLGLVNLAFDLTAMLARIDGVMISFESLQDKMQNYLPKSVTTQSVPELESAQRLEASPASKQALREVAGFCTKESSSWMDGQASVPEFTDQSPANRQAGIQRLWQDDGRTAFAIAGVLEAARSEAAAIAAAAVAMERAANLELVHQLHQVFREREGLQAPPCMEVIMPSCKDPAGV